MKIKKLDENFILFDNGSVISGSHYPECCEENFIDPSQLEDIAMDFDFPEDLVFEKCDYGFRFGDGISMFFVPCYSEQNGYYSCDIDINYKDKNGTIIKSISTECALKEW